MRRHDQQGRCSERVDSFSARPYNLGMSADGSLVYGHLQGVTSSPIPQPFDEPWIWTRDGQKTTFEVYLRSMGLGVSGWRLGSILDMSDDGKTFLAFGSAVGGNGYQVLIVVPEPRMTLLLSLGLAGLSARRGQGRRA